MNCSSTFTTCNDSTSNLNYYSKQAFCFLRRHYLYMNAAKPNSEGDTAWFAFPTIAATGGSGACRMRFFYHMFGRHVGQLNIYKRTEVTAFET